MKFAENTRDLSARARHRAGIDFREDARHQTEPIVIYAASILNATSYHALDIGRARVAGTRSANFPKHIERKIRRRRRVRPSARFTTCPRLRDTSNSLIDVSDHPCHLSSTNFPAEMCEMLVNIESRHATKRDATRRREYKNEICEMHRVYGDASSLPENLWIDLSYKS